MGWDDPEASMRDERLDPLIRSTTVKRMIREIHAQPTPDNPGLQAEHLPSHYRPSEDTSKAVSWA
jgi:hypothetical protein